VTIPISSAAMAASTTPAAPAKGDDPAKVKAAAQQFEALLIGQLLKTAREAGDSGWMGTDQDDAGQIGMEMAEQQFAQMLASKGGLGMADMIAKGLQK